MIKKALVRTAFSGRRNAAGASGGGGTVSSTAGCSRNVVTFSPFASSIPTVFSGASSRTCLAPAGAGQLRVREEAEERFATGAGQAGTGEPLRPLLFIVSAK